MRTGLDRLTQRMKRSKTNGGALGTGRQSWRRPRDWHYDDLQSDSDAMVMGEDSPHGPALSLCDETTKPLPHTLRHVASHMPGLLMDHMPPLEAAITSRDAIEVHVDEAELDNL